MNQTIAKAKAKALRTYLARIGLVLKETQALEAIANLENEQSWNVLSAKLASVSEVCAPAAEAALPDLLTFLDVYKPNLSGAEVNGDYQEEACAYFSRHPTSEFGPLASLRLTDLHGEEVEFEREDLVDVPYLGNSTWTLKDGTVLKLYAEVPAAMLASRGAYVSQGTSKTEVDSSTDLLKFLDETHPNVLSLMLNWDFYLTATANYSWSEEENIAGAFQMLTFTNLGQQPMSLQRAELENSVYKGDGTWEWADGTTLRLYTQHGVRLSPSKQAPADSIMIRWSIEEVHSLVSGLTDAQALKVFSMFPHCKDVED